MKIIKIGAAIFLFGLISITKAEDVHYVIDYSMLTNYMNYNPKYDYYPGLYMKDSKEINSSNNKTNFIGQIDYRAQRSAEIHSELDKLDKEWREVVNTGFNSGLGDFMKNSLIANQIRFRMKMLSEELNSLYGGASGCGSRGGPGYRRPNGQCASWQD